VVTKLKISHVSKSFGDKAVLIDVNLEVPQNKLVTILGTSGGGKTTLLRLIAGFESVDSGEIHIGDRLVSSSSTLTPPEKRNVGYIPQDASLFSHLTVAKNIEFGLQQLNTKAKAQRVTELLELIDLADLADSMPSQLSGGQQQRVAIARALAPNPDVVLLDEPFAALDAQLRTRLRDDVKAILVAAKATAIMVTHDQEEALSIADRVAILRDGRIAQFGTPNEIYSAPVDVRLAQFLGDAVVLPGQISNGKVKTSLGELIPTKQYAESVSGLVAIRPENLYLQPNVNGDGKVIARQYFGHDAIVEVQTKGISVKARTAGPLTPEIGMPVTVWVRGAVNFYPN
jgi:iron(III) transport system ATP-binding protein